MASWKYPNYPKPKGNGKGNHGLYWDSGKGGGNKETQQLLKEMRSIKKWLGGGKGVEN